MTPAERLRGGAASLAWQAVALLATGTAAFVGWAGPLVAVAFIPGALKAFIAIVRPESRPAIRRIGYLETVLSTLFAVLAGIGLGLGPP